MRRLVWFRSDLRCRDNPALHHAARATPGGVAGVFVICPRQWREHHWADVKVDFVLRTLDVLRADLARRGVPVIIRTVPGFEDVPDVILDVALEQGCGAICFNREYEVNERRRDTAVVQRFEAEGLEAQAFTDQVIIPPGAIRTRQGGFYRVFGAFRRTWLERVGVDGVPRPLRAPPRAGRGVPIGADLPDGVEGFAASRVPARTWPAGEAEARRRLRWFASGGLDAYASSRDVPGRDGTSTLSPYLAVGAISARRCLEAALDAFPGALGDGASGASTWIDQLIWREFYRHVLVGVPRVSRHRPYLEWTDRVPWAAGGAGYEAWCAGRTGVPLVDAAMRQLQATGWMHNRLRMVAAMYLTKNLLVDWRAGERHFMRHLVDGDLANNNGGWQWAASTGTDAVPYFRVFNPYRQAARFDPDGAFIRRWVPELSECPARVLHDPGRLDAATRRDLGYPEPIVDHQAGKERAVAAFRAARSA